MLHNLQFPITFTLVLLLFFIFSLYIFYIYFHNNFNHFFGNMNKSLYITSTIICIILFLPFVYYINFYNLRYQSNIRIFIDLFIMIFSFILWMISIYYNNTLLRNIFIVMIIIVNIDLIYVLVNDNHSNLLKSISLFGLCYLLFHHFVIDFILYNIK